MRLFSVVALVLFAVFQQQSNPRVRPKEPSVQQRNTETETDTEQQQLHRDSGIAIQECENCTIIEKCVGCSDVKKPSAQEKQTDPYDPRQDALYRAYLGFTIAGVLVALLGIGAIYLQTTATRNAAEATRQSAQATERSAVATQRAAIATQRSVKLQENTQRQWVDLRNWRVFRIKPGEPIEIEFQVTNPTSLPLTLHGIVATVDGKRIDEDAPVMLLTPNDPIPHGIGVPVTPEQEALWTQDRLHFEVECSIMFADSHNIHWIQEIGVGVLGGHTGKPIIAVRSHKLYESGVPGEQGSREVELP